MTVFSGSCVARSPEGMHDLFQAVLSCHKLFCPLFYFPSFYSCPALIPLPLLLQHPFTAVSLELYLLLSPCPWITVPLTFLSFTFLVPFDGVFYFSPPFVEQAKPSPRHPINPNLPWLAAVLKTDENRALLATSSLPAFIYLCFFMLFTSSPPPPPLPPFRHIILPSLYLICCHFLSSLFCSSSNPPSALSEN